MKSKLEKNMESLWRDIEAHAEEDMTESNVTRLNVCVGAYKALCMVKGKEFPGVELYTSEQIEEIAAAQKTRTLELDGDTEFERVIMEIPADYAHMVAITSIFADHMEGLKITNNRAYNNVMARLREVAR
jgi:hypothetical protein